jgi:hypothetical protein
MIRDYITIRDVVDRINGWAEKDPEAVTRALLQCVRCNKALADDPTFMVGRRADKDVIGLISVLCSLFGFDDKGGPFRFESKDGRLVISESVQHQKPEQMAHTRMMARSRGESVPYTVDEQRVLDYLNEASKLFMPNMDPIGFLIASHAALMMMVRDSATRIEFPKPVPPPGLGDEIVGPYFSPYVYPNPTGSPEIKPNFSPARPVITMSGQ